MLTINRAYFLFAMLIAQRQKGACDEDQTKKKARTMWMNALEGDSEEEEEQQEEEEEYFAAVVWD